MDELYENLGCCPYFSQVPLDHWRLLYWLDIGELLMEAGTSSRASPPSSGSLLWRHL